MFFLRLREQVSGEMHRGDRGNVKRGCNPCMWARRGLGLGRLLLLPPAVESDSRGLIQGTCTPRYFFRHNHGLFISTRAKGIWKWTGTIEPSTEAICATEASSWEIKSNHFYHSRHKAINMPHLIQLQSHKTAPSFAGFTLPFKSLGSVRF